MKEVLEADLILIVLDINSTQILDHIKTIEEVLEQLGAENIKKLFETVSLAKIKISYTTFFPKILSPLNSLDPLLGWLPLGGQYIVTGQKI